MTDGQERRQFVVMGKVGTIRRDDAVGGDPQRPAVNPFLASSFERTRQKRKVISKQEIIVRSERDELTACLAQRDIPVGISVVRGFRKVEQSYASVLERR